MVKVLYEKAIGSEADIVFSNFLFQYENKEVKYHIKKRNSKEEYLIDILDRTSPTAWWGRLYKRSLIENNKIRVNPNISVGEDYSTVPRLFYFAKKIVLVEECFYHYVLFNPSAMTKEYLNPKQIDNMIAVQQEVDDFFKDKEQVYKDAIEKGKAITNLAHAFSFKGVALQKKGFNTFSNINYKKYYSQLPLRYKIAYILASHNLFWLLSIMSNIYAKLK
jgi:hypothetical protein